MHRVETAEHLSKLTGQTTVAKEQITTSGRRASALLGQVSRTIQEVQRPLLTWFLPSLDSVATQGAWGRERYPSG